MNLEPTVRLVAWTFFGNIQELGWRPRGGEWLHLTGFGVYQGQKNGGLMAGQPWADYKEDHKSKAG